MPSILASPISKLFDQMQADFGTLVSSLTDSKNQMASNSVSSNFILGLYMGVSRSRTVLRRVTTHPDVLAYLAAAYPNQEITLPMLAGVDTALTNLFVAVEAAVPKNDEGYLLKDIILDGEITVRPLSPEATASIRASIDNIVGAING